MTLLSCTVCKSTLYLLRLLLQKQRVAPLEEAVAEQLVAPVLLALRTPARSCAGAAALLARAQALSSTALALAMQSSVPLGPLFAAVHQKVRSALDALPDSTDAVAAQCTSGLRALVHMRHRH